MCVSLRALQIASMLYIELPIAIFLVGWVRPIIGIPLTLLLIIQFLFFLRESRNEKTSIYIHWQQVIALAVIALTWVVLSGAGHRGEYAGDYLKHNALLNDLIRLPWPVHYLVEGTARQVMLVYYTAYYLPSAVWGKMFGWASANIFLMLWTYGGILLVVGWLTHFFSKKPVQSFLLFIGMSGLDLLGRVILYHRTGINPDWEWWAGEWQYSGVTTLLFHVPQHALGAWIAMSFLLSKKREFVTFYSSLFLWSPFVWIGTLPFVLYQVLYKKIRISFFDCMVGFFVGLVCGMYIASSLFSTAGSSATGHWLWQRVPIFNSLTLLRLMFFYLFEFGICFAIIMKVKYLFLKNKALLYIATILLLCIPWFRLGLLNDFAMRVSIPALFILALFAIHAFLSSKNKMRLIVYVHIFIAALYPLLLIANGTVHTFDVSKQVNLSELDTPQVRVQYTGSTHSIFSSVFAKQIPEKIGTINLTQ